MISYEEFLKAYWSGVDEKTKSINEELCERYPFLIPRNDWTGEVLKDYEYEFTYLDDIPVGWKKSFGIQMCEDLREILLKADFLDKYQVVQAKEKFGGLRWYDNGVPNEIYDEYRDWLDKYEELSMRTCVVFGEPAKMTYMGWVCPQCEECFYEQYGYDADYKKATMEE